jgi:hypothetical protein
MSLTRVSQTPMITAGAYDVGDAVGGKLTFAGVLADGASHGVVRGCRIIDKGRQSVPLELWLFREDFTHSNDNAVFNPSDSDLTNLAAVIQVGDWFPTAGNSVGQPDNLPQTFTLDSGDTTLYGQLVSRGAPTYASTSDLVVELIVEHGAAAVARRSRRYFAPKPYPPLSAVTIAPAENYHTIHLKIEFDPPANVPASTPHVTGSYLRKGRWVKFHPALLDAKGDDILYTVLFGLDEDTTYPVKLEFTRTIDATGAIIERQTFHRVHKTRKSPVSTTSPRIYVATNGSNSNTGANPTDSPAGTGPKKTIPNALAALVSAGSGGEVVLLNGTYDHEVWDFSSATDTTISGIDGTATAYRTIRAQNEGMAVITGRKLLNVTASPVTIPGGWTQHPTISEIWYTDFSDFVDAGFNPDQAAGLMRNETTGNALFLYYHLTTDQGADSQWQSMEQGTLEGWLVDWTNSRLYVRQVGSGATSAPPDGQYSASINLNRLLDLVSCDYLILDGLAFDMCRSGQQSRVAIASSQSDGGTPAKVRFTTSGGVPHQLAVTDTVQISGHSVTAYDGSRTVTNVVDADTFDVNVTFTTGGSGGSADPQYGTRLVNGAAALRLSSCTNVVVRNCTFTLAGLVSSDSGNSLLTIEDNSFTGQDLFGKFIGTATTLNQLTMWNPVKDAGRNEISDILLNQHGGNQTVVRRNTFSSGWFGINASGTAGNENNDYYENDFTDYLDSAMGFEGFGTSSGNTNAAAWHNQIDGSFSAGDIYPFARGPFWLIANRIKNLTFNSLRKGADTDATPIGSETGCGHLLVYHNTLWTEYQDSQGSSQGLHPWITFNGQGNTVWMNNILSGTGNRYIADYGFNPPSAHRRPISFITNAFYTTASPAYWTWRGSIPPNYGTEAAFLIALAALDDDETLSMTMIGNIYGHGANGTKPFPNGINGGLNAALEDIATQIDGVTEIAGDASGNLIIAPLDIGFFPKWAST